MSQTTLSLDTESSGIMVLNIFNNNNKISMIFNLTFTVKDSQQQTAMDKFLFLMQFLNLQQKKLQNFKGKNNKKNFC
jgi:hypothetical protein